jgi:hypothetical protein
MFFPISSSSSLSILGVIALNIYLFLDFPFYFYFLNEFEDFLYIKDKLPLNYYILPLLIFLMYL